MKIATWNVERLKHYSELNLIEKICDGLDADILILTETDNTLNIECSEYYETEELPCEFEIEPGKVIIYKNSERRVSIYTRFPTLRRIDTYDSKTSLAVELDTPDGKIIVYGTIIGILGNRDANFEIDLKCICEDIQRLSKYNPMIVCGDFNCSFSDGYYYTKNGREILQALFKECDMTITTAGCSECIDHIVVSDSILQGKNIAISEWNEDKKLSDHKGIAIIIEG